MEHPRTLRTATALTLGVALLTGGLAGCGADEEAQRTGDSAAVTAADLGQAQLTEFKDAKPVPDQTESGSYAKLETVQQAERLRKATTLDKPACMDAVNQWGGLEEVRSAPTSLATFTTRDTTITHMLVHLPGGAARKAVDIAPPEDCDTYQATAADGTKSSYSLSALDLPTVGDESRAFLVETEVNDRPTKLYSLIYRQGDRLGTTSVLGPDDAEALLREFTDAAVQREEELLG